MPKLAPGLAAVVLAAATALLAPAVQVATARPATAATPVTPITAPPMGWNSWNRFGCNVNENLIRQTADAMVANGMRRRRLHATSTSTTAGWRRPATRSGRPAGPTRRASPTGSRRSPTTCTPAGSSSASTRRPAPRPAPGFPASLGHETRRRADLRRRGASTTSSTTTATTRGRRGHARGTRRWATRCKATGRPIVYSICNWGQRRRRGLWGRTRAATSGAPPATSATPGQHDRASLDQQAGLEAVRARQAPGTTRTCWRSATAA